MVSAASNEEVKRQIVFGTVWVLTRQLWNALSRTPLLMVVAEDDRLTPTDLAIEAYQRAREAQKLVIFKGGHFNAYREPGLNTTAPAAVDWFKQHLMR